MPEIDQAVMSRGVLGIGVVDAFILSGGFFFVRGYTYIALRTFDDGSGYKQNLEG